MRIGGFGVALLLLVCFWMPLLAWKSAKRIGSGPLPLSRRRIFTQILVMQFIFFVLAFVAARENDIHLFGLPRSPLRAWAAAALFLVVALGTVRWRWRVKPPMQKARLYSMLPHSRRDLIPYAAVCLAAGIGEEVVYRGVLTPMLMWLTGSFIAGALISAAVFAIAHVIQGWRAVAAVFVIALFAQALVWIAESLIPAMVVHALYDFVLGLLVPRWYARDGYTSAEPLDVLPAPGQ